LECHKLREQFPAPGNASFFEVAACRPVQDPEAPVAQAFRTSYDDKCHPDLFEIIMFSANGKQFLRIGYPGMRSLFYAQEIVLNWFILHRE